MFKMLSLNSFTDSLINSHSCLSDQRITFSAQRECIRRSIGNLANENGISLSNWIIENAAFYSGLHAYENTEGQAFQEQLPG